MGGGGRGGLGSCVAAFLRPTACCLAAVTSLTRMLAQPCQQHPNEWQSSLPLNSSSLTLACCSACHHWEGDPLDALLHEPSLLYRPDWGACQALAAAVVNASQPCPSPEGACAMGAFQPVPSQKMYAVTGL